ncbi:DEAD-like helicase [Cordyceps fumosorosea ARSEF 2679]|uniref:DEAD-like helicase n=1 Tax=Cordyceps fumosorosea (strain ARSEF 2679) TaxID=1081104 RepID=A0A167XIL7_CORFA|nr:DEAD-like helicase [Cordyceps fumosorosea ARSEF 2679]OAA65016.1 DEAD-like helicase [Cordyceps fumosorosea ARSEF 2679]
MGPLDDEAALVAWYQALRPLRVDLIGDFAGKELFAIHGEALLTHCISEAKVEYRDGFQILHAIHAVETFLSNLKRRGCQFHIIWFSSHECLCIPSGSSTAASGFHRLTRTILIKHLCHHSASMDITFEFPSAESAEFQNYTTENALRFFLCLDGLSFDSDATPFAKWHLAFIHDIGTRGYSVALINNFEFKSSKAFASMLPPSQGTAKFDIEEPSPLPRREIATLQDLEARVGIEYDWSPWSDRAPLSAKDMVSFTGLCNTLLFDSSDCMKRCAAAYILHLSEVKRCNLSERPCVVVCLSPALQESIDTFFTYFTEICASSVNYVRAQNWDLFDIFDSRIIRKILENLSNLMPAAEVIVEARNFAERLDLLTNVDISEFLPQIAGGEAPEPATAVDQANDAVNPVMPFRHPTLDNYLEPVHVVAKEETASADSSKVFRELSHWHNAKKAVDPRTIPPPAGYHRRLKNQKMMADTIAYSASLTNSAGKIINPETIITAPGASANSTRGNRKGETSILQNSKLPVQNSQPKIKKSSGKAGRDKALEEAWKMQRGKLDSKARDMMAAWDERCRQFQGEKDITRRLGKVTAYLAALSSDARSLIGAEILLYICHIITSMIILGGRSKDDKIRMVLFAKMWSTIMEAEKLPQSRESLCLLEKLSRLLEMPITVTVSDNHLLINRQLPFPKTLTASLVPPTEALAFQLEHCGPFLERSFDPAPDPRVSNFEPDAWQRRVLDVIDAERSLFVVAPTSAGKTFISFYAMKQVLRSSDDGVLVYVAPTKALVNQIAAEVQARFSKSYDNGHSDGGRSVWAIHTRDHRINNPTGCQVLVTVPHILQIMLLAPSNAEGARPWSSRVKRIIFDEIHCIGQADDGIIWEQLLLLAPCPFIALSATVGNPLEFMQWLEASEKVKGREVEMIVHSSRYSDLRKFLYRPPGKMFAFRGLRPVEGLATPGLDEGQAEVPSFNFIHPIVSLTNRNRGTMDDIALEPRDCLSLWRSMSKHKSPEYPIDDALCPQTFFPAVVKRSDVLEWGSLLKKVLQSWMQDTKSPFSAVQSELAFPLFHADAEVPLDEAAMDDFKVVFSVQDSKAHVFTMALPLLTDLHTRGALPAILFNYDRDSCEATVVYLAAQLARAEKTWKESSPEWARKLDEYAAWKAAKSHARPGKTESKKRLANSRGKDENGDKMSKLDMLREEMSVEASKWDSFEPDAPLERFSFADTKKMPDSESKPLVKRLIEANVQPKIIAALSRGIAVHHAGMNRNYRQVVEMLFRKGYLRVVIATGTLALGINMPCKTVVFFGDSVFLTPLNYHQASGRAGRRGFDLLGNVVFAGMPLARALKVMSSRLPDLGGHFPLSTTLVVRLLGLAHHTGNNAYATRAINSVLSLSRLYLGGPSDQMAIRHHLRFSIEYLRRQRLLSANGAPLNFAGLIGHLYFTENAVFAFHSLLKEGYFHRLCETVERNPEAVMRELVLVLAHLFCRIPLGIQSNLVRSPSVIALPPLPDAAERVLRGHNQEALDIFQHYVSTYIKQRLEHVPDTKLPFTGYQVGIQQNDESRPMIAHLPPMKLRSPFAALSGLTDTFDTIHELCATVRSDVFLEESAVPYIRIYPADTAGRPWNAYIYDFFKHGELTALVRDNKIKRGDVWFHLKDFSLVLATIVTSLENFVRLDGRTDDDAAMADVQDVGDAMQEPMEELRLGEEEEEEPEKQPAAGAARKQPKAAKASKKKTVALASWEDDVSDDDSASGSEATSSLDDDSWQDSGDGNLPQVIKTFKLLREEFEVKFRKVWA